MRVKGAVGEKAEKLTRLLSPHYRTIKAVDDDSFCAVLFPTAGMV